MLSQLRDQLHQAKAEQVGKHQEVTKLLEESSELAKKLHQTEKDLAEKESTLDEFIETLAQRDTNIEHLQQQITEVIQTSGQSTTQKDTIERELGELKNIVRNCCSQTLTHLSITIVFYGLMKQYEELRTKTGEQLVHLEQNLQAKTRSLQETTKMLTDTKALLDQQQDLLHIRNEVCGSSNMIIFPLSFIMLVIL